MGDGNYMVTLDLERAKVLIVGGGRIATRKLKSLPRVMSFVKVVALEISPEIVDHLNNLPCRTEYVHRAFDKWDIDGFDLAFAATDDSVVNAEIARLARGKGILVNDVSDSLNSSFSNVAALTKGGITIGVSSNPRVPGFSKALCKLIDELLPEEIDKLLLLVAQLRVKAQSNGRSLEGLDWMKIFESRVFELIRVGDLERAEESLAECLL